VVHVPTDKIYSQFLSRRKIILTKGKKLISPLDFEQYHRNRIRGIELFTIIVPWFAHSRLFGVFSLFFLSFSFGIGATRRLLLLLNLRTPPWEVKAACLGLGITRKGGKMTLATWLPFWHLDIWSLGPTIFLLNFLFFLQVNRIKMKGFATYITKSNTCKYIRMSLQNRQVLIPPTRKANDHRSVGATLTR